MQSAWKYPFAVLGVGFALVAYAFWPHDPTIPVLIYHDIASSSLPSDAYTVERRLLERQLEEAPRRDEIPSDTAGIESEVGKALVVFAYPYGEHNARIDAQVATSGYTVIRASSPADFPWRQMRR